MMQETLYTFKLIGAALQALKLVAGLLFETPQTSTCIQASAGQPTAFLSACDDALSHTCFRRPPTKKNVHGFISCVISIQRLTLASLGSRLCPLTKGRS